MNQKEMYKYMLIDSRERQVNTGQGNISLWYDLLESGWKEEGSCYYDIRIRQYRTQEHGNGPELDSMEETCGITDDKEYARYLYELVIEELVMPESLIPIIDDQMSDCW